MFNFHLFPATSIISTSFICSFHGILISGSCDYFSVLGWTTNASADLQVVRKLELCYMSWLEGKCSFDSLLNLRIFISSVSCSKQSYPISTLPEHLHSTFPSHAKLPENTLTEKKNIPFPSLTLITCLTGPPVTPPPFTGRPSHTLSYTTILFLALKVNGRFLESLPVVTFASLELKLPVFSFH